MKGEINFKELSLSVLCSLNALQSIQSCLLTFSMFSLAQDVTFLFSVPWLCSTY